MFCLAVQEETELFNFSLYMTVSESKSAAEYFSALIFHTI